MYYELNGNILPQIRLVDKAVLEPPYVHKRRQTDEYILYIMTKGTLYLQEGDRQYTLSEGDTILLDTEFEHVGLKASCCEYFYIHFRHSQIRRREKSADYMETCLKLRSKALQEEGGAWERYQDSYLYFPKQVSLPMNGSYLKMVKLLQEAREHNRNKMENYKVACACRIMEAFVEITRESLSAEVLGNMPGIPQSYRRVHELLGYLNTNYAQEISSDIIEEQFSCNFDYLNRVFKRVIGKTIFVVLNEIRIQHAKEMLSTTSLKVAAVGYRVGFRDECYFSKVFKKYTGVSPGQYERLTFRIAEEMEG